MKKLNKVVSGLCMAVLALVMLTGCEGSELYKVGAPDWLEGKLDSIANARTPDAGLYNIGSTALNSPFWTLGKSHVVPAGGKLEMLIDLTVNPDNKYFKNFYVVITNDVSINPRGSGYFEYGVMRFDNDLTKNSEWGTDDKTMFTAEDRAANISANFTNSSGTDDIDPTVQDMNGQVKVIVDRSNGGLKISLEGEKCTKTYTRSTLETHNVEPTNENIRITLGVEGSFVNVIESNIDPVDDSKDSEPVRMTLKGVSDEYLIGTTIEEIMANVTAEVDFGEGGIKTIDGKKLTVDIVPDMTTLGAKTLVAAYNKTAKGEISKKPVMAIKGFSLVNELSAFEQTVVVPTPLSIGAEDCSTPFWGDHTANIKVEPKETKVVNLTNYTSGGANWNNFLVVLCKDNNAEYAVLRADNYGWGDGYVACTPIGGFGPDEAAWAAWLKAMNGAKVTAYITNVGDGTANVKAVMYGTDGKTYTQEYFGINTVDPENFFFRFTVDGSHLVFDKEVGAKDCSTPFWGDHSTNVKIAPHTICSFTFTNYSSCGANWNNFLAVLCKENNAEYAVLRADNFGWGDGYAACTPIGGFGPDEAAWVAWRNAMNGAKVTVLITNTGDGTANVKAIMHGNNGVEYIQEYNGINTIDPDDFYARFTVDGSYLVFE